MLAEYGTFEIYNSRNYKGLVAQTVIQSDVRIYNSRNYKGLVAIRPSWIRTLSIYNSRNYKGLVARCQPCKMP